MYCSESGQVVDNSYIILRTFINQTQVAQVAQQIGAAASSSVVIVAGLGFSDCCSSKEINTMFIILLK